MEEETSPRMNMRGKSKYVTDLMQSLVNQPTSGPDVSEEVTVPTTELNALSLERGPIACSDAGAVPDSCQQPDTRDLVYFEQPEDLDLNWVKPLCLIPMPRNTSSDGVQGNDKQIHSRSEDNDLHVHKQCSGSVCTYTDTACGKHFIGGFVCKERDQLLKFVRRIEYNSCNSGVFLKDGVIQPCPLSGTYREKEHFIVVKNIKSYDVLHCQDKSSGCEFVLKTIVRSKLKHEQLVGIEYLVEHCDKTFLPDIYGVYKDEKHFYVFEQFIGESTVDDCSWNVEHTYNFAKALLKAVKHLHDNNLVHFDIKPINLMVLDPADPHTVVLIDFESAKSPKAKFHNGGYTLVFLPQWHEALLSLESFDAILMSGDLWAVACVLMKFLQTSDSQDLRPWTMWKSEMVEIKSKCRTCKICTTENTSECFCKCNKCQDCKNNFLDKIRDEGHRILEVHLGHLKDSENPELKRLIDLLKYLTDKTNFEEKSAAEALRILEGDEAHE